MDKELDWLILDDDDDLEEIHGYVIFNGRYYNEDSVRVVEIYDDFKHDPPLAYLYVVLQYPAGYFFVRTDESMDLVATSIRIDRRHYYGRVMDLIDRYNREKLLAMHVEYNGYTYTIEDITIAHSSSVRHTTDAPYSKLYILIKNNEVFRNYQVKTDNSFYLEDTGIEVQEW